MGYRIELPGKTDLAVMEGQVLANNRKMIQFARGLGFSIQPVPNDIHTMRVVKALR
jgi:hypothetical protein